MPKLPGVYFFRNAAGEIIYVGKAKSLRDRVSSYFATSGLLPKTARLMADATSLDHQVVESEIDALLLEANLIRKLAPKYNVDWKDGKSYPLIEITIKDTVPMVRFVRQETNPKARYFGPYPTGSDLTWLLRFLRRLFPYVSQPHRGNKPCLRSHLGLCPCPEVFTNKEAQKQYKKDLNNLIEFLEGKRQVVQKRLVKEMEEASSKQDYEKAGDLKAKIDKIGFATMERIQPWEYELNPNLVTDRRETELKELAEVLGIPTIEKIECYDISNTAGTNATGAQVVFVNGVPEKKFYRRYKIKKEKGPDDFAMMEEMLKRRLKSDVVMPELIVIDGGKGQLGKITKVVSGVKIIGLAKRLETIYTDDGKEIQLGLNSPALHVLQRLRDEAHRFSRKYHFYLRTKNMLG